ncbi:DUF805 domain-containing protein [Apilactobacillus timberlakei]|uniref:DUF805 domain-containing protein n=1 Tax=Apilactobacillus timberlakei TaxID=2008380 RepID=A0ABY2YSH8_9LACO|nr:DUF805 domain-containing protein [Apilactobacillus timberlakei]TPR13147.1 DUF805 domain-containing protein [Apilactobacillus timberlakei]TPR14197.1 DUF805 domain-containing protein [Apilactobacillus timberlakei]TPR16450.1 DUF805 domain-containing protein [Apilactobacillus timberlakei]
MVGIWEAYKLLFTNYTNFGGKSSRAEYWWVYLVNLIIGILLFILSVAVFMFINKDGYGILMGIIVGYLLTSIYSLIILIPSIALSVRRYRDVGISPWWFLVIVVASFIFLIMSNLANIFYIMGIIISMVGLVITILPSKK